MIFTPMQLLVFAIVVTAAARIAMVTQRRRHRRALQSLAREWRMHYSPRDHFHLAARVATRIPVPGAAEVRVIDLIYGTEHADGQDFYRFILSVEFTLGATRAKRRLRRVLTFREPKGRSTESRWSTIVLAPEELPLLEQYTRLNAEKNA